MLNYSLFAPVNPQFSVEEQILTNRGINIKDVAEYLNPSPDNNLPPLLLNNMEEGAKLLFKHLSNPNAHIHIQVDSDMDGFFSAALLLNYLHDEVPGIVEKNITYSFHPGKQHGIDEEAIIPWTTLVIAPDSSSDEPELHNKLIERGIDVLVLDHHMSLHYQDSKACIINNQLCDYPTKSLCGTAIVYKFCKYLDDLFRNSHHADQYLDLVAAALISDMMDLRDIETHYLVSLGLHQIKNPYLKEMVKKNTFKIGNDVTPMGIAFYVAPFVNAINRSGEPEEKELIFESLLNWKAYDQVPSTKRGAAGQFETRVEQAVRVSTNVKTRQNKIQDKMLENFQYLLDDGDYLNHKILILPVDENEIDRNLVGLVANKFMAKYQRPVAILALNKDNNWAGSARGYEQSALKDFRSFCLESGLVEEAPGHANAHGLTIAPENLDKFVEYADETLKDIDFSPIYKVDYIYNGADFRGGDILRIADMKGYWGQNLPESLIAIKHLNVTKENLTLMSRDKNPTLKITLPNGVSCIKFKSSEEEYEALYSENGCVTIDLIAKCNANEFNGRVSPQLLIEDYEIINSQQFYF